MDTIKKSLKNLTAADKDLHFRSLCSVHNAIIGDPDKINELQKHGGIKILVKCLNQVDRKELLVALGILRLCSMNELCRNELFNYNFIENLSLVQNNTNDNSIITCICRTIANLTASKIHIPVIYKYNIPSIVVNISKRNNDVTSYWAIQTLKKIWANSSHNGRQEMLECKAVRAVSLHLTSTCKNIAIAVMQAQILFLTHPGYLKHSTDFNYVITQIIGNRPSDNATNIENFSNLFYEYPELVGKIIFLICRCDDVISKFSNTCLIYPIVDDLKFCSNNYSILTLCQLLKCSHNQERFSKLDFGVKIFMDLLKNTNPILKELALHTLVHFKTSSLLNVLVNNGLINVLITDFCLFVKATTNQSVDIDTLPSDIDATEDEFYFCPTHIDISTCPENDNVALNTYTPDYTPNEIAAKIPNPIEYSIRGDILIQSLANAMCIGNKCDTLPFQLLWQAIFVYIKRIKHVDVNLQNAIFVLKTIFQYSLNFISLLKDEFVLSIHRIMCRPIHQLNECKNCKTRYTLGMELLESASIIFKPGIVENVIELMELDADVNLRIIVALNAPLVLKSTPRILNSLVDRYDIIITLIDIVKDYQNPLFDDAVGAVVNLFHIFDLDKKPEYNQCYERNCHKNITTRETTVTFILDDGTLIKSNKSLLSIHSSMFRGMFRAGGFKESYENTVRLHNVSSECFKCILLLLDAPILCECMFPTDINLFLELLVITDMFMFDLLFENSCKLSVKYIPMEGYFKVYEAINKIHELYSSNIVDFDDIRYLFSSNSCFPDRVKTIKYFIENYSRLGEYFTLILKIVLKEKFSFLYVRGE